MKLSEKVKSMKFMQTDTLENQNFISFKKRSDSVEKFKWNLFPNKKLKQVKKELKFTFVGHNEIGIFKEINEEEWESKYKKLLFSSFKG